MDIIHPHGGRRAENSGVSSARRRETKQQTGRSDSVKHGKKERTVEIRKQTYITALEQVETGFRSKAYLQESQMAAFCQWTGLKMIRCRQAI